MQINETAVARAQAALDTYSHLERTDDRSTAVWHLMADMIEYCDAHGIDLDAQIALAREEFLLSDPTPSA